MTGIAICGLGNIGAVHLRNLQSLRGARITGVYDIRGTEAAAEDVPRFDTFDALLQDRETTAVVIATPTDTHRALAVTALEAGKHVFLEKPIAGTMADAEAIAAAADAAGPCLQIGFCERFNPQYLEAKRHVKTGSLGEIRAIYSSRVAPYSLGNPNWELGIFDTAVHNIDLILWLFDSLPSTVEARAVRLYADSPNFDSAVTSLRFGGDRLATDHITWLRDNAHPLHLCARSRMSILGSLGSFEIDLTHRPSSLLTQESYSMPDTVILGGVEYPGCLKLQFDAFLQSVEEGAPVLASAREAVWAERVVLAARRSLQNGQAVPL